MADADGRSGMRLHSQFSQWRWHHSEHSDRWGSSYGRASFPQDGVTRQYCFGSLSKEYVYHIYIVKPAQQDFPATGNVTVTA